MINSAVLNLVFTTFVGVSLSGSLALAANNEMKNFKFRTCDRVFCIVVESEKGWLSQATGAFVASGAKGSVKLQLVKDGKVTNEFFGDEVASQPEVYSMTVDSQNTVVLVDVNTGEFEVIAKSFADKSGGRK